MAYLLIAAFALLHILSMRQDLFSWRSRYHTFTPVLAVAIFVTAVAGAFHGDLSEGVLTTIIAVVVISGLLELWNRRQNKTLKNQLADEIAGELDYYLEDYRERERARGSGTQNATVYARVEERLWNDIAAVDEKSSFGMAMVGSMIVLSGLYLREKLQQQSLMESNGEAEAAPDLAGLIATSIPQETIIVAAALISALLAGIVLLVPRTIWLGEEYIRAVEAIQDDEEPGVGSDEDFSQESVRKRRTTKRGRREFNRLMKRKLLCKLVRERRRRDRYYGQAKNLVFMSAGLLVAGFLLTALS